MKQSSEGNNLDLDLVQNQSPWMEQVSEEELLKLVQAEAMELPDLNIAVSGLAGRFPKSDSVNEFEQNLYDGKDMINDQDNSRFTCGLWNLPPRAGRLKDLTRFDSEFFGFTQEEANYIDFQLRILYEVVYESILDAGVNPAELRGTKTGVFFGLHCNEFENALADDPSFKSNGYFAQFAVKVAQYFDLRGVTVTFDAACASGFVGLHNAVQALKEGTVEQAIVCSSNIPIHPTGSFIFLQMQMLSPTGYSRFLDSRADGYVKSEACVSLLLQKKHLARRNYASVMATMTSVDGYKSEGITFPSYKSQERLIRACKQEAGLLSDHVEYLEAHGTGTPAGDPQEARAVASVYFPEDNDGEVREQRRIGPLMVGSVKTNMGHSEAASGLCSLTKVALMLENELIYQGLHYEQPNTNIESIKQGKLKFAAERQPLRARVVPLSCYGFGGSNVHAIVRANERPAIGEDLEDFEEDQAPRLVVVFGRNEDSINTFFDKMLAGNDRQTRHCLSDDFLALVDSISRGQIDRLMEYRGFMLVDRRERKQVHRSIKRVQEDREKDIINQKDMARRVHLQDARQRHCHMVLPGLGCQWPGMAAGLGEYKPFWSTIERLLEILTPFEDQIDLNKNLTVKVGASMCEMFVSIVAYQIALINIIKNQLKVNNLKSTVGHSLGEISCAYAAGLFNERETIMVAYHLGTALDQVSHLIGGKMVVLWMNEREAQNLIEGYETIQVSCINGPKSLTISGRDEEIERFLCELEKKKLPFKELECSKIALHNETIMNAKIKATLKEHLLKVLFPLASYDRSKTEWISSSSMKTNEANAEYFAESMCKKVNFLEALQQLSENSVILELGPHGLFESQVLDMKHIKLNYAKLMRMNTDEQDQKLELLKSIGNLYQLGLTFQGLTQFHLEQQGLDESKKLQFPVRRQTPSLSSLWRWNHQNQHFVPRYPIQFSKSSAKCEMPVDIVQDRDKFIADHCVEGRILYPATGYLFLIWRVFSFTKRQIYDACFQDIEHELVPIEFHNVRLLRATILSNNRASQIYIHYEEGTGRFEIKEGGSVVAEGYAKSPSDSPDGLLYEHIGNEIKKENLELTLTSDDVYKQFRLSGYDYGPTFQNIQQASSDGRKSLVKFNGHFVALTDSILQSIFLAISQYAPSGGLFLPTRFEYVRFQPDIILKKIREAKWCFDLSDGSLNTQAKREIMTKIMERERGLLDATEPATEEVVPTPAEVTTESSAEERLECIFETYCDPITGIIVTDGIEMRGIKATPAPRRLDNNNEVLMESYQFIRDIEDPLKDENLTQFATIQNTYARICDSMSLKLLAKLCGKSKCCEELLLDEVSGGQKVASEEEIDCYKSLKLKEFYRAEEKEHYDIQKNGDYMLLSILDQLQANLDQEPRKVKEVVEVNRLHLMHDLLQAPFTSERLMRPVMETIIENSCVKKQKLRLLEINLDDGLLKLPLQNLIQSVAPSVSLDYSLAHPQPSRLSSHKALSSGPIGGSQTTKTFALTKSLSQLFQDEHQQLTDLDLIVYKDISCYSLPKQVIERNHILPVLSSLNQAVCPRGFVMMVMRQRLSLAERILLSLAEPQLIGLSLKDLERMSSNEKSLEVAEVKIRSINAILASRMQSMLSEAARNKMICLAQKSDDNGCTVLLFQRTSQTGEQDEATEEVREVTKEKRLVLRVTHENQYELDDWLEELKRQFKKDSEEEKDSSEPSDNLEGPKKVWLCAVATREKPINGLIGMMQALSKEVGWLRLRCFYDLDTFKNHSEPIGVQEIEASEKFQVALQRDLQWNCVDEQGYWGSYKHLTINNFLSYDSCLCSRDLGEETSSNSNNKEAYVNNATKGDLSSFTWFEAPFKYLSETELKSKVQVAYATLNFRDVMLATGRLPLDAIPLRLAMSDCLLGLEFAGLDSEGKRVMGMVFGRGLATHVLCPTESSIKLEVPEWMSLREAATLPVVYATVIMALVYRGRMQRGETLLVHAGSGGVGQAAIRLAQHFGVEVFTTVGSQEKRQFLKDEFNLDDGHIFNSRDTSFEWQLMEATRGRGVDLILNSLADDKLQASLRCLADGGRFLEIGKYDMSTDAKLELLRFDTNKTFHGILLDKLFDTDECGPAFVEQLKCVLATMRDGLAKGYVRPIKHTLFQSNQIEEAFRFMATGKHMGKVLVEINASLDQINSKLVQKPSAIPARNKNCVPRFQLSPVKTYVITGGLGGFGLELVKWLVAQGARHLVLAGRSGLRTGYQRVTLSRLESNNDAKFKIITSAEADLTKKKGASYLCQVAKELSPSKEIGGLFHLAMVLKDSLLENLTAADFDLVCRPKIEVARQLDLLLRKPHHNLDYFVAFSSVASGKGNAGQTSYAYANSFLERLCERRKSQGEHGLAIQWGAIGDVGVAYENLGGNNIIIGGTLPQRMPSCLQTLAKLINSPFATCLSVVPVNRNGADGALSERGDLVGTIMHVLGIKDPSKVSEQSNLGELGLDSLMAVEIRQYIEREYDMTLNIQEIRSLTIAKIRDISENGKPSSNKQNKEQVEGPKEVNSYGANLPSAQYVGNKLGEKLASGHDLIIEKNLVQGFVPDLRLPKDDFCFLNYSLDDRKAPPGSPLFFLAPIHGQFDRLQLISRTIRRPCIGLNWTRRLGKAETMSEVVEIYLDLLKRADWIGEFNLKNFQPEDRVVDLVGYSYGATVAFEMMLALHKPLQNGSKLNTLKPGKLILLDGSPKQVEMGSQYLSSLTSRKPMKLTDKVNELLMVYILAHTSKLNLPRQRYLELQVELSQAELDVKGPLASRFLIHSLNLEDEDGSTETEIAHSMEAFCRKYHLISQYKATKSLPDDCSLIRAEKLYLKKEDNSFDEDLELSSVVQGKVSLYVMPGDHDSFLTGDNSLEVSRIISRTTSV